MRIEKLYHETKRRSFALARFAAPRPLLPLVDRAQVLVAELEMLASGETPQRNREADETRRAQATTHEAGDEATPFFQPGTEPEATGLAPLMAHALVRPHQALHGEWAFIVDQANLGDVNPMMHGGVGRGEEHGPDELLEYSFAGAATLRVPGDWNTQKPELFWYRGVVWYRREFLAEARNDERTFLYFGGANFEKAIYLNGELLARHSGGFTPFTIEITRFLRPGANNLIVKCDSRSHADEVPTEYNDWLNYGGLTREVLRVTVPETFIRQAEVQLLPGRTDCVRIRVQLDGEESYRARIRVQIPSAGFDQVLHADGEGVAHGDFPISVALWSPEQPTLHDVHIAAVRDTLTERIGFRSLEVRDGQILLNHQAVYLRGIALHEEREQTADQSHGPHNEHSHNILGGGRAWGAEDAARVIAHLHALNGNFLRLAHYPHNEYMVRACDEAGVLLWAEMPVYHSIRFGNPATLDSAKRQFADLIDRDRNRAAVILWSIANETEPAPARNEFLAALAKHVRERDPTRLVTAALLGNADMRHISEHVAMKLIGKLDESTPPPSITIRDPLEEHLDVLGYNEYYAWYTCAPIARMLRRNGIEISEGDVRAFMLTQLPLLRFRAASGKPIVVSEFGAEAQSGLHEQEALRLFSEEYQARVYQQQLAMLRANPQIRGFTPWILKDFRSPYRLNTALQQYWNRKGVISEAGVRKQAFGVLAAAYADIARAANPAHDPGA